MWLPCALPSTREDWEFPSKIFVRIREIKGNSSDISQKIADTETGIGGRGERMKYMMQTPKQPFPYEERIKKEISLIRNCLRQNLMLHTIKTSTLKNNKRMASEIPTNMLNPLFKVISDLYIFNIRVLVICGL